MTRSKENALRGETERDLHTPPLTTVRQIYVKKTQGETFLRHRKSLYKCITDATWDDVSLLLYVQTIH